MLKVALPKATDAVLDPGLEPHGDSGISMLGVYQPCDQLDEWSIVGNAMQLNGGKLECAKGSLGASDFIVDSAALPALSKTTPTYIEISTKINISEYASTEGPDIGFKDSAGNFLFFFDIYRAVNALRLIQGGAVRDQVAWVPSLSTDYYMRFCIGTNSTNTVELCAQLALDAAFKNIVVNLRYSYSATVTIDKAYVSTAGEALGVWTYDDIRISQVNYTDGRVALLPWQSTGTGTLDATNPFNIDENVLASQIGSSVGVPLYQVAFNLATDGAFNGTWLTLAQLNTLGAGKVITDGDDSYRLKFQYNSDGVQALDISGLGSSVDITPSAACDYPVEADVLEGVVYDNGNLTGTLEKYGVDTNPNDSIRQQIVDVLITRFATILISNGYKTNMGNNVTHWLDTDVPQENLPHLAWRDEDEGESDQTVGQVDHLLEITCIISANTLDDVYASRADLIQAIGADVFMSGLAGNTTPPVEQGDVTQNRKKIWAQEYKFIIEYPTDRFDEYTQ